MTLKTNGLVDNNDVKNAIATAKQEIIDALNNVYKVGDIKASTISTDHGNWLLCDGRYFSRTGIYQDLFNVINYGFGRNNNNFKIPDYRGMFLRGMGTNAAADIFTKQNEGLPNIKGTFGARDSFLSQQPRYVNFNVATGAFSRNVEESYRGYGSWDNIYTITGGKSISFSAQNSNAIYGNSTHVTPVNYAVYYFIKAKKD